jgi:DNA-binding CsgD family transcriptional regulator
VLLSNDLVALAYEAALDPGRWPVFVRGVADAVAGTTTHILVQSRDAGGDVFAQVRADPGHAAEYRDHYSFINPYILHPERDDTPGLVHCVPWANPSDVRKTEFFADFLVRANIFPVLSANLFNDRKRLGYLVSYRPLSAEPFGECEARLLSALLPHLQRALQVSQALTRSENARHSLLAALDALAQAVVVLDRRGRVWAVNRAATAILSEHDGLKICQGELRACSHSAQRRFSRMLASVLRTRGAGIESPAGGFLAIERPSGRAALAALLSPLSVRSAVSPLFDELHEAAALVLLAAPDEPLSVPSDLLRSCLGLTRREAEVAQLLLVGHDIRAVASQLHISYHTARVHQRVIYEKSGVHDKAQLVRSVLRCVPAIVGLPRAAPVSTH